MLTAQGRGDSEIEDIPFAHDDIAKLFISGDVSGAFLGVTCRVSHAVVKLRPIDYTRKILSMQGFQAPGQICTSTVTYRTMATL